jgi:hypothetical protein
MSVDENMLSSVPPPPITIMAQAVGRTKTAGMAECFDKGDQIPQYRHGYEEERDCAKDARKEDRKSNGRWPSLAERGIY